MENDSVRIAYWFEGNGQLQIEVKNLSDRMIYVDWAKSSLIQEGQSFSLANNQSTLQASTTSIEWIEGIESGDVSGTITAPSTINFIPGGSYIRYQTRPLDFKYYDMDKLQGVQRRRVGGYQAKTVEIDRVQADGFQTFLFLSNESDENRTIYEHEFWISKIMDTQFNGNILKGKEVKISKTTGTGQVLGTLGGLALLTLYVAADADE